MKLIGGIDEVGRGAWAGPVVVGAVVADTDWSLDGLTDSKQMGGARRKRLLSSIKGGVRYVGLGWVTNREVDRYGLSAGLLLAAKRAVQGCDFDTEWIIDGTINLLPSRSGVSTVPRADGSVPVVSAASVVAKEARDDYMRQIHRLFPHYQFAAHVGYGTVAHKHALSEHGITSLHRLSFKPVRMIAETV